MKKLIFLYLIILFLTKTQNVFSIENRNVDCSMDRGENQNVLRGATQLPTATRATLKIFLRSATQNQPPRLFRNLEQYVHNFA